MSPRKPLGKVSLIFQPLSMMPRAMVFARFARKLKMSSMKTNSFTPYLVTSSSISASTFSAERSRNFLP
jgi:hypothetical protein